MTLNRSKFKEALNGLTSDQRTALLYLENQMLGIKSTYMKNSRSEELYKEINDSRKKIDEIKDELIQVVNASNMADITALRSDMVKAFDDYIKEINHFVDESMKKVDERYNRVIDYDNKIVNKLLKDRADQQNAMVDAGILPEKHRTAIVTLRDHKKRFNGMKNVVDPQEMIDNKLKELDE